MTRPLLPPAGIAALRAAFQAADYTPDGVASHLGERTSAALYRGDLLAVRHALATTRSPAPVPAGAGTGGDGKGEDTDADPLGTLIRLFPAGDTVSGVAADAAFGPLGLVGALAAGLVEPVGTDTGPVPERVRAAIDIRPYGDDDGVWWVVSDLGSDVRPGPLRPDHVLGIGGASVTLAGATVRPPVATALDLGTGCGVQALHLSRHARSVTATDVSARALAFAATTAALNGLEWELLAGDLVEPVAGRRFDLVVSNPPFVVGPGRASHTYRDSGRAGDAMTAEVIAALPGLLTEGGWGQLLGNWVHHEPGVGPSWEERVAGWLAATGCDGYAVQREVLDPAAYVALWLRDAGELAGPDAARRTAEWLDWFAAARVEAIGFGLVTLHASGADQPMVRVEEALQEVSGPLGPELAGWFDRAAFLRDADLLATRLVTAPGLRLRQSATRETGGTSGQDDGGWQVDQQVLALETGWRWAQEVDPVTVALVSGCDGSARLGDQLAVLAAAYGADPAALTAVAVPLVSRLIEHGMVLPVTEA